MATPLWRQAYDAVEAQVTPRAEHLVRTPTFAVGAALVQRAQVLAKSSAQGVSTRAWHLLNLPAGSDIDRLRSQVGALDREVRRLTMQLDAERRAAEAASRPRPTRSNRAQSDTEESHADGAEPADRPRPRPAGRGTQRTASP